MIKASSVERSGAAQALSEVMGVLDEDVAMTIFDDLLGNIPNPSHYFREGFIWLLKYLPRTWKESFEQYLSQILPIIVSGLADEVDVVREAALLAGHVSAIIEKKLLVWRLIYFGVISLDFW